MKTNTFKKYFIVTLVQSLLFLEQVNSNPLNLRLDESLGGNYTRNLGSEICTDSFKSLQPSFEAGLNNLYSFTYIREALKETKNQVEESEGLSDRTSAIISENSSLQLKYCTSVIGLGKNDYQYDKYLIVIKVTNSLTNKDLKKFYFLFQDASVQAFHNVGNQPWVGLNAVAVDNLLTHVELVEYNSEKNYAPDSNRPLNILDLVRQTSVYQSNQDQISSDSISAMQISRSGQNETYMITWALKSKDNPFIMKMVATKMIMKINKENSTYKYAVSNFTESELTQPLEQIQEAGHPSKLGYGFEYWKDYLLTISADN